MARLSPMGCELKLRWCSGFGDFNEGSSSSTQDAILMYPSGNTVTREHSHLTLVCSAPAPKNVGISETMRSGTRLVARFFDQRVTWIPSQRKFRESGWWASGWTERTIRLSAAVQGKQTEAQPGSQPVPT